MYTNTDVTLYLYSKEGKTEKYTRTQVESVFWDDVRQSTFLKTGQRDSCSVMLIIPWESVGDALEFTQGRDLAIRGIVADEVDCSSQENMSKSLAALKASHGFVTITSVDEKLFGSEEMWHYELACK